MNIFDLAKIIPSIVSYDQIDSALKSNCKRINLLVGNINDIEITIGKIHRADKKVYLHIEMIDGLGRDKDTIRYLAEHFRIDGIISTHGGLIAAAKKYNISSVQRIFAIDTAALKTSIKSIKTNNPDEVELMPGLMPSIIKSVKPIINKPLIVGGLIKTKKSIENALNSGADYVSTGYEKLWQSIT